MDPSTLPAFFVSSLIVKNNAVKNIIFRTATIILSFVILRLFGLIAFRCRDYTSFLMFAEDYIQKALFVSSRGITARQSLLVAGFALIAAAGGFYDTMLWAIDNPGFIVQHRQVNGATLSSQKANNPALAAIVSGIPNITSIDTSFEANLYNPGLNVTIPGVYEEGTVEVVQPPHQDSKRPSIWLDNEGFTVGTDYYSFLDATNASCTLPKLPGAIDNQTWYCGIPNGQASVAFGSGQGSVAVEWDAYHMVWIPRFGADLWSSFDHDNGAIMMKRVFTVTKGHRRHTFKQVLIRASMFALPLHTLNDGEITDFMHRSWLAYGPTLTPSQGVQELINKVLYAKDNNLGTIVGVTTRENTSVSSIYTDYLTPGDQGTYLRFMMSNVTIIRSETLAGEPTPGELCPGAVCNDYALAGSISTTGCESAATMRNQTIPANGNGFFGLIDVSSVVIFDLGSGLSNISSTSTVLNQTSIDWFAQHDGYIDGRLISRAMLISGDASAVTVIVATTVAAISGFQLLLCVLPAVLAIVVWWFTRHPAKSYYQSSFLSAVLATTHTAAVQCEELGYIHSMPEITIQKQGRHVTLGTPHDGRISATVSTPTDEQEMLYEPLILDKDSV